MSRSDHNYQAVLFDMDGVIVDTCDSVTAFWQEIASEHGVNLTRDQFIRHIYGCPAGHTLDRLFPGLDGTSRGAIMQRMTAYESGELRYRAVPGAVDVLHGLRGCGIRAALVTSGFEWKIEAVTSQLGIRDCFDIIVGADDIARGKPSPECYLLAARALGLAPWQCVVFEDALSGVEAAVAAGALCVGIGPADMAPYLLGAGARSVVPDFTAVRVVPDGEAACRLQAGDLSLGLRAS